MLKEKSKLHSEENFTLKIGGHSAKKSNKKESQFEGEIVRFKLDVECSIDFAERFLNEYFSVLKEPKQSRLLDARARVYPTNPLIQPSNELPAPGKEFGPSEPDNV